MQAMDDMTRLREFVTGQNYLSLFLLLRTFTFVKQLMTETGREQVLPRGRETNLQHPCLQKHEPEPRLYVD